jgi:hypothetical protein
MTESMITVALVVGDPAHEDLQLNETSLAAAARTIEVHGAVIHGRWDSGRRSTVWCFDIERARAADLKTICKTSGPASLSPLSGGQSGQPRSFVSAEGRRPGTCCAVPAPGCPGTCAIPVAVMSPRLRHLSVPCPQELMHLAADQAQGGLWTALNCTHISG